MTKKPYILMLEQDPDDRSLTESSINELGFNIAIQYISYSNELFQKLEEEQKPILILLDYNSTPLSAPELVSELKAHPQLSYIPVVVLGEGLPEHLIRQCYQLGANSFITKPVTNKLTRDKIETFFKYWLNVAEIA